MKNLLTFFLFLSLTTLHAQDWKTFTYNKEVLAIEQEGNTLWIATSGGLLKWDLQTETYTKLTTEDGLISNRINAIAIDDDGKKWLATRRGVSVVDGAIITNYTPADGLHTDDVNSVVIDSQGNKWFATKSEDGHSGLSKLDNQGIWSTVPESIGFGGTSMKIDTSDNIFIGKYQVIKKYTPNGEWVDFVPPMSNGVGHLKDMTIDENQELWGVNSSKLFHIASDGTKTDFGEAEGLVGGMKSVFFDSNGLLWIGVQDGVWRMNSDSTFTNFSFQGQVGVGVHAISEANGKMLFGTENDITTFDGNDFGKLVTQVDLGGNIVRGLDIASDGSVWMGTNLSISKFKTISGWDNFYMDDGLVCNQGYSLLATSEDKIIVANSLQCLGISFIDVTTGNITKIENDTFGYVMSMNEDLSGNIWFGYYGPPYFDNNFAAKVSPNDDVQFYDFTTVLPDVSNNKTTGVAIHPNGDVYFSSRYGLYRIDVNGVLHLFQGKNARTIFVDSQESVWIARGDYWFSSHRLEKITPTGDLIKYQNPEINDYIINQITEDDQQNIWIASENGLFKLSPDSIYTRYSTVDGLADNHVTGIKFDADGEMWVSTLNGVSTTADAITATTNVENLTIQLQLYPNPTSSFATLDFVLENNELVQLEIYNVAGQLLLTPFEGKKYFGKNQIEFEVTPLPQGIYFCKIKVGGKEQVLKFVKM